MQSAKRIVLVSGLILMGMCILAAHGWAHETGPSSNGGIDQTIHELSYTVTGAALVLLIVLAVYAVKKNSKKAKDKKIQFIALAAVSVLSTLFLAGSTIYLNTISPTGGPVHWHTDYEVWNCGTQLDLIDPMGIENRVGTWAVHEHNDNRMHVEGTIVDMAQASFHHFFEVTGGNIEDNQMQFPTDKGMVTLPAHGTCYGQPAELQVFLYRVTNPQDHKKWVYTQTKLPYPSGLDTVMSPEGLIPPGDCVIVEYGPAKASTEHLCSTYKYAIQRGELNGR